MEDKNSAIAYCVRRCVQGLASSQETSRSGFFICLVEVLRFYSESSALSSPSIIKEVLSISEEVLNIGNTSKSEEGEYICGKIFCLAAIIRSDLLAQTNSEIATILQALLKLGAKRNYLRVVAYKFIIDFIHSVIKI